MPRRTVIQRGAAAPGADARRMGRLDRTATHRAVDAAQNCHPEGCRSPSVDSGAMHGGTPKDLAAYGRVSPDGATLDRTATHRAVDAAQNCHPEGCRSP